MARLVIRKGRNAGAEYRLNADRLILGRRSAAPVPVLDPKASRDHAAVLRRGEQFFLHDLSRNGTLINNVPASKQAEQPTALKFGDHIQIGDTILEMVDETKEPITIEIPGYKILERIGSGGMGTVYKARQLSMDRVVALKVLNEKYSNNREFVDRFIREARAAGKLNHPNVIHVHDVSKAQSRHYFSMEYVDGFSVKELLRIHGRIDCARAVDIALQTAKALEFAHENRIIHRDIKPDNIMLTKDGIVKIADLGIAKSFEPDGIGTGPDGIGSAQRVLGTPHYMAPEQALGKEIDHRVDLYALGATLYHMLTGHTPFSGLTAHEVIKAHIQESLPPIQEFCPTAPDALCFVVERMMAKLPEKRYPNMTRLVEDLDRVLKGSPEGIERVAEGASTIQPAVKGQAPDRAGTRPRTEDVGTGIHTPVAKIATYAGLGLVFAAVVVAVVVFLRPWQGAGGQGQNPPPDEGHKDVPPIAPEEMTRRAGEAKKLLASDPVSAEAEGILKDLVARFPAEDEPKRLLTGIQKSRQAALRTKAAEALAAARQFETEHGADAAQCGGIAQKFRAAQALAAGLPDLLEPARERAAFWEAKQKGLQASQLQAAWSAAVAVADAAAGQKDFDGAAKAIQDFLAARPEPELKTQADAKLKALTDDAEQFFQTAAADADQKANDNLPAAVTVWSSYLKDVKDAAHLEKAQAAQKALADRAEGIVKEEDARIAELAKQYEYDKALAKARAFLTRWAGTSWAEARKERVEELALQGGLHRRVYAALAAKVERGPVPVPLPFKLKIARLEVEDWGIVGPCDNEQSVRLQALVRGTAPEIRKRFGELAPEDQYKLYLAFLPAPLSADDQKALAVFCKERGLDETGKSTTAPAPPGPPAPPVPPAPATGAAPAPPATPPPPAAPAPKT